MQKIYDMVSIVLCSLLYIYTAIIDFNKILIIIEREQKKIVFNFLILSDDYIILQYHFFSK